MNSNEFREEEIERMGNALDLTEITKELTDILLQTSDLMDLGNGRSTEAMVSGCMFVAVRELQEPVSLAEISEVTSIHTREIFAAYMDVVTGLNIELQPSQPKKYVPEYVNRLNEEFDSKLHDDVIEVAKEVIDLSHGSGMSSGSSPMGIAAGAVYVAADLENKKVTQAEVAEVAGVTPGTVRTNAQTHRARVEEVDWL